MSSNPARKVSFPKKAWVALQFWKRDDAAHANHRNQFLEAAKKFDLDALEDLMNRRLRTAVMRHAWLAGFFVLISVVGLVALTVYLTAAPTMLRIAVGPRDSDNVRLVTTLAARFKRDHAPIQLEPVILDGPARIQHIVDRPNYDLAVIRGEFGMSQDWPVVAILRQNVTLLIVPAPAARGPQKGKAAKPPAKIEKIADLAGRRVGIVMPSEADEDLLRVILNQYGVVPAKVQTVNVPVENLKAAIQDSQVDALMVAGALHGDVIAQTVTAASAPGKAPTFLKIDQAEALEQRNPIYDKFEVVEGAFGGAPAKPGEAFDTINFPEYLVARKTLSDAKVAALSKLIYTSRQALNFQLPGVVKIESPSTDKDAAVLVHPGTDAYLNDNQKTFFDRWGDQIFYGLLILPIFGSALAAVAGYFKADNGARRVRLLHRLLQAVKKARNAPTIDALDQIETEVDNILGATIQQAERNQLDEMGMMSFSLAIEQARLAIAERRNTLLAQPPGTTHIASAAE
jgi:NMT1-like family